MAFNFRLEALLRLRKSLKEQAEQELARWIRRRENVINIIRQLKSDIETERHKLNVNISNGIKASEYQQQVEYIDLLFRKLTYRTEQLKSIEDNLIKARQLLKERHMELQVVEKLKEKAYDKYLFEEFQKEQKEADELATIKYISKQQADIS